MKSHKGIINKKSRSIGTKSLINGIGIGSQINGIISQINGIISQINGMISQLNGIISQENGTNHTKYPYKTINPPFLIDLYTVYRVRTWDRSINHYYRPSIAIKPQRRHEIQSFKTPTTCHKLPA